MSSQNGVMTGGGGGCPETRLTRSALIALRNSGGLSVGCPYTITDANAQGTLGVVEIMLVATATNALGGEADILTTHDTLYWSGTYDIDLNDVLSVTDNLANVVSSNVSIIAFPFGVTAVARNVVSTNGVLTYTLGTVTGNTITAQSNVSVTGGSFVDNVVNSDANVTSSGNAQRNMFESQSNATITSGDFRENRVEGDATVTSSTAGDVDNCIFSQLCVATISGTANMDNCVVGMDGNVALSGGTLATTEIMQTGNLTMSGGSLSDTTIEQDAEVAIISGANYENVFGASTVYRQVGTGYIRYSSISGTTVFTNGNTNISNVTSYVSTINTTGSSGTISNSILTRVIGTNMQNIGSLTITDSTISDYATLSANNASRMYLYRSTVSGGSRILVSAGSRVDASYTTLDSYSYLQSTISGGVLTANYCDLSALGYIRNTTPNSNRADRCSVTSNSNVRFDSNASGCRVYYCNAAGGSSIACSGSATNCYIYYCNSYSLSVISCDGTSTTARIYYCTATARSYVRSVNCPSTHYMYYCSASASGRVQMNAALGRIYACDVSSQSIFEKRGAQASNVYYSTFSAYYYAYITRNAGTSSGLYGMGRRSYTTTDPVTIAPYNSGAAWQNF